MSSSPKIRGARIGSASKQSNDAAPATMAVSWSERRRWVEEGIGLSVPFASGSKRHSRSYRRVMAAARWVARIGCFSAFALLATAATHATGSDRTPPVFAGLKSATTCIPGPVGGGERVSRFRLVWPAAKDNVTPPARIAYDVYRATSPGAESFSRATYTTRRGATSFVTPPLPANATMTYYFVVRARDVAGNRDRNRRERPGQNLCV
jgi:hypothetical protein